MSAADKQGASQAIYRVANEGGVAVVTIDLPGEPVNKLTRQGAAELERLLDDVARDASVRAIVFVSGKPDNFIAGADIDMLNAVTSAAEAQELAAGGQVQLARLEASGKPVVAAINGAALGGGLETALACHYRIATDDPKTVLGQPEVQLGLLPGAGGTQRLPRLIGLTDALDLILTGKNVRPAKAKKLGLVDEVVPKSVLLAIAKQRALELADGKLKPVHGVRARLSRAMAKTPPDAALLAQLALEETPVGRQVIWRKARSGVMAKTGGHYPAPLAALDAIHEGLEHGQERGYKKEAELFGQLVVSDVSRRLREIFFATNALKKDTGTAAGVKPRQVKKLGLLGGGLMGGGIAYVSADNGYAVRVKDKDDDGVARGLSYVRGLFDERVKKKSLTRLEENQKLALVTAGTDYAGFGTVDLVIEAVFEDLELKRRVLRETEAATKPGTIFASNTSSLPITQIQEASSRPESVIGMHYFSPVHKMPLLEIITTPKTSPETIATAVAVGKRQGKTVIVVNDGVGFYTSRILAPYVNEAAFLLAEGAKIEDLDKALVEFGFPVGPIKLLDEVGIDVGAKVAKIMHHAFGERLASPPGMEALVKDGRLGKKAKKGFYTYDGKRSEPDAKVYALLGAGPRKSLDKREMAERCALQMVNEAAHCLGEGILRSPRDGDIGAIFGLGFPPFLGGPFRYADAVGAGEIVRKLEAWQQAHGARFAPAPLLVEKSRTGKKFYS